MIINITAATGNLGTKITEEAIKHFPFEQIILSVRNPSKAKHFLHKALL